MKLTIVIGTDVQTARLASSDGLGKTEERRSEGRNALLFQDGAHAQSRAGTGDLDAESILGDTNLVEFPRVQSSMLEDLVGVVRIGREDLQENATLDVAYVLFAHKTCLNFGNRHPLED